MPESWAATHPTLRAEYVNASHWPKHLLVQYDWQDLEPIHAQAGLYVLFIAGLARPRQPHPPARSACAPDLVCAGVAGLAVTALRVLLAYDKRLRSFLAEVQGGGGLEAAKLD